MGRKGKIEQRNDTAAYNASQALFTELRIATVQVGNQKSEIAKAKEIVQTLHIKIVDPTNPENVQKHQDYKDYAVKAWRLATDTYVNVFRELEKVTAADPSEGREADVAHNYFKHIAETAAAARKAAFNYPVQAREPEPINKPSKRKRESMTSDAATPSQPRPAKRARSNTVATASPAGAAETASSVPAAQAHDHHENIAPSGDAALGAEADKEQDKTITTTSVGNSAKSKGKRKQPVDEGESAPQTKPEKVIRLSEKIKYDDKGHKILWEKGAKEPLVPRSTMDRSNRKAWDAEKARQKREKNRMKKGESKVDGVYGAAVAEDSGVEATKEYTRAAFGQQDYIALDAGTGVRQNGVAYEDVSEEVTARLKAKEEKRSKKDGKKRKRDSGEVMSVANLEPVVVQEEKPSSKRFKD
ncbi:hypothetical protein BAUCODRAFT_423233 [Baudoinia panamericana UAMH 10762]|uniref:Uncharacterized protein n=1 Tax=Baudoinia panamericana (strain UAMH 10762) TaxID=717646 RepID=M2LUV5_BAUPA|nr:uncharacterized protein BAUCODRAFT_423233 [Baudoinia panamericana UAMH 10762]EMC98392.1 hypothetical protein BAUCODRAFT_423233 [Baudoinia panamericana UAMH 10762]